MDLTATRSTLTAQAVMVLLQGALDHAASLGKPVYVAAMDASARLVGFVGSDAAPMICADVARNKAYTSVSMRMPTADFRAMLDVVGPGEREIFLGHAGHIAADGGFPIVVNGLVVGGIGVSGAGQAEDGACAQAGVAAFERAMSDSPATRGGDNRRAAATGASGEPTPAGAPHRSAVLACRFHLTGVRDVGDGVGGVGDRGGAGIHERPAGRAGDRGQRDRCGARPLHRRALRGRGGLGDDVGPLDRAGRAAGGRTG